MENWEKKYQELISGFNPGYSISGTIIRYYIINPSIVYCEYHVDKSERDSSNRSLEIRMEEGNEFENEIFKDENITEIVSFEDPIDTFKEAIRLMYSGIKSLGNFNILVEKEGFHIKPDILEKVDEGNSIFGRYHYRVIEIKSAKYLKEEHIMQAALYTYVIGLIQEYFPYSFDLINGNKEKTTFIFDDYKIKVQNIISDIRAIHEKNITPDIIYPGSKGSDYYPWSNYHTKIALGNEDISLIPYVGIEMRKRLVQNGFKSLDDLINATNNDLTSIDNIGKKRAKDFQGYARAIKLNQIEIINDIITNLLNEEVAYYIDFEGIPAFSIKEGVNGTYLIGIAIIHRDNVSNTTEYSYFVDDISDKSQRTKIFKEFIKTLEVYPEAKIVHWGAYEKTCLKKELPELGLEKFLNRIVNRMVDAESLLKKSFYLPTPGTSLKLVSQYFGYKWGNDLSSGADSIGMYFDYLQLSSSSLKKTLLSYNLHDVKAMYHTIKSLNEYKDNA